MKLKLPIQIMENSSHNLSNPRRQFIIKGLSVPSVRGYSSSVRDCGREMGVYGARRAKEDGRVTDPLPICVLMNGMRTRRTKSDNASANRGRLAAAPNIISGRSALRIISAARSTADAGATGLSIG